MPAYFTRSSNSCPAVSARRDPQPRAAVGVARRLAVEEDLGDAQAGEVEGDGRRSPTRDAGQHRVAVEPVADQLVAEPERVVGDVERVVAVVGDVGGRSLSRCLPRADRIADPAGAGRDALAAHHERNRAHGCVPTNRRGRKDNAVGAQSRTGLQRHRVHAEHPVVEQVRLHDAAAVDGRSVVEGDEVGLGQPVGVAPDAAPDLRAEQPQPDVQRDRALAPAPRTTARPAPR